MQSPVLARLKQKGPSFCLLQKARIIIEEDLEIVPKWRGILKTYRDIEEEPNHEWVHKALHSIVNAVVYQERIYFAITRKKLTDLFKNDLNWKKPISLSPKNYSFLLAEMIDSGLFQAHPENERLKANRKPMIYRVIDENILSLINPTPDYIQEKQVLEFVENCDDEDEGNIAGNIAGNIVGNTEGKKDRKGERENSLAPSIEEKNRGKYSFDQYLMVHWPKWPRFEELAGLIQYAITNCEDFDDNKRTVDKFKKHLENNAGTMTPNKKSLIKKLIEKFEYLMKKNIALKEVNDNNLELQQPDVTSFSATRIELENETIVQNNTIRILNATFGRENIELLKRKMQEAQDDAEKDNIKQEIIFWESVING